MESAILDFEILKSEFSLRNPESTTLNQESLYAERLPFVWKSRKFRGEFKWNGSYLSRYYLLPVLTETTKIFLPFVWITTARLHVERK